MSLRWGSLLLAWEGSYRPSLSPEATLMGIHTWPAQSSHPEPCSGGSVCLELCTAPPPSECPSLLCGVARHKPRPLPAPFSTASLQICQHLLLGILGVWQALGGPGAQLQESRGEPLRALQLSGRCTERGLPRAQGRPCLFSKSSPSPVFLVTDQQLQLLITCFLVSPKA